MSDIKTKRPPRDAARADTSAIDTAVGEALAETAAAAEAPEPAAAAPLRAPEPMAPLPPPVSKLSGAGADVWAGLADAQAEFSRGLEQMALELTGMTRTGIAAGSDAAIALLRARSFAEIVEINAGLARRGVDAMVEGSARLSEIGLKTVANASRPVVCRLGGAWGGIFGA